MFRDRCQPYPIPKSTSFSECSEDEIRELHSRIVDLLHDPAGAEPMTAVAP